MGSRTGLHALEVMKNHLFMLEVEPRCVVSQLHSLNTIPSELSLIV
jgi:hypothetical protein